METNSLEHSAKLLQAILKAALELQSLLKHEQKQQQSAITHRTGDPFQRQNTPMNVTPDTATSYLTEQVSRGLENDPTEEILTRHIEASCNPR